MTIKQIKTLRGLLRKTESLPVENSGIDSEGDAWVKLNCGTIFYGKPTQHWLRRYFYHTLSKKTKKIIKKDCLDVAIDIVIRYIEGGLMYGGPKKLSRYSVKKGDYVSEMGAYMGYCSIKLAQQTGPSGKVICIEPFPENYRLLVKNIRENKFEDRMIPVNMGVWDTKTFLEFSKRKNDGQSSSALMNYEGADFYKIEANTLDNIFNKIGIIPDDFMIVQLNGAEMKALRGMTAFRPKNLSIAARYDVEGENAAIQIKTILEDKGYQVEIDKEDFVFAKLIR